MFEKWAVAFADHIKKTNPDETEPHDVLVFGFTILFNLMFTFFFVFLLGWILGVPLLSLQVAVSFTLLRILTGGAHLDQSLACSITSLILVLTFVWLPASSVYVGAYGIISVVLIILYAPYYEAHQLKHSLQWERKKKLVAILWVIAAMILYYFFSSPGFVFGTLLQAMMLTPAGIRVTHKLNRMMTDYGGEKNEEKSS